MRRLRFPILLLAAGWLPAQPLNQAQPNQPAAVFNFDRQSVGEAPEGFVPVALGGTSRPRWRVMRDDRAPSRPHVLAQLGPVGGANAAALLRDNLSIQDGDVAVRFKIKGTTDYQSVGIIFRYENPDFFDGVLVDAQQNGAALYRNRNGKKRQSAEEGAVVTADVWHSLRVTFRQGHITVFVDGDSVLDKNMSGPFARGQVGLWTIGDTLAQFDDLTIAP